MGLIVRRSWRPLLSCRLHGFAGADIIARVRLTRWPRRSIGQVRDFGAQGLPRPRAAEPLTDRVGNAQYQAAKPAAPTILETEAVQPITGPAEELEIGNIVPAVEGFAQFRLVECRSNEVHVKTVAAAERRVVGCEVTIADLAQQTIERPRIQSHGHRSVGGTYAAVVNERR